MTNVAYKVEQPELYFEVGIDSGDSLLVTLFKDNFFSITQSINQWCPYLYFKMEDKLNFFKKPGNRIKNGMHMYIKIGRGKHTQLSAWSLLGTPKELYASDQNNSVYEIRAIPIDLSRTLIEPGFHTLIGNSTDALSYICDQLGMNFDSNATSDDSMTWVAPRTKHYKIKDFMETIAHHSYVSPNSIIMTGIGLSSDVSNYNSDYFYRDVPSLFSSFTPKLCLYSGEIPSPVLSNGVPKFSVISPHSTSRSDESSFGGLFGLSTMHMNKDGTPTYYKNITVNSTVADPDIDNRAQVSAQANQRTAIYHVDGNTHDMYEMAKHLNTKGRLLYSHSMTMYVKGFTGLNLFDLVTYSQQLTSGGKFREDLSGYYMVTGKNQYIVDNRYEELLEITCGGYHAS